MKENRTSALIRPVGVVNYIKDQQYEGRVLNEYGIGGYLIHELTPEFTVYIDGRTGILYPPRHVKRYQDVRMNPEVALREIDSYGIDFALLEADRRTFSVMYEVGRLELDFADHKFALWTSKPSNFPLTGKLLGAPACWSESFSPQLEQEFIDSLMILPRNSLLLPLIGFMKEYAGRYDRRTFLEQFAASGTGNEMQIRFAAYQALSFGFFDTSAQLFESIEIWDHREFLAAAMAYVKSGNYAKAEEVIDSMMIVLWPHASMNDTVLLYRLLKQINRNSNLSLIPTSFIDELEEKIRVEGKVKEIPELDYSLLCPSPLVTSSN